MSACETIPRPLKQPLSEQGIDGVRPAYKHLPADRITAAEGASEPSTRAGDRGAESRGRGRMRMQCPGLKRQASQAGARDAPERIEPYGFLCCWRLLNACGGDDERGGNLDDEEWP
jgi:hypothetical protein